VDVRAELITEDPQWRLRHQTSVLVILGSRAAGRDTLRGMTDDAHHHANGSGGWLRAARR